MARGVGLAEVLFLLSTLGANGGWLWALIIAAAVILVAIAVAARIASRRSGRLAAVFGAVVGFAAFVVPVCAPAFALGHVSLVRAASVLWALIARSWICAVPLAVVCWIGTSYWRSQSGDEFWSGPGGAIVRGGLVAGLVALPVRLGLGFYSAGRDLSWVGAGALPLRSYPWIFAFTVSLSGIGRGAVVTGVLAAWRPPRWLGALIGGALLATVAGLSWYLEVLPHADLMAADAAFRTTMIVHALSQAVPALITGAVAGSYAQKWTSPETRKEFRGQTT